MDRISYLLALNAVKGLESDRQVEALTAMGLKPSDIAPIVGKSPNAVRIILHTVRKSKKKPKKP